MSVFRRDPPASAPPLTDILAVINEAENGDTAFIIAAAINLYGESMRRRHGRILFGPKDVESLFTMINMLLHLPAERVERAASPAKPTKEEADFIATAGAEGSAEMELVRRH